jgi:hypothetical protein
MLALAKGDTKLEPYFRNVPNAQSRPGTWYSKLSDLRKSGDIVPWSQLSPGMYAALVFYLVNLVLHKRNEQ